MNKKTIILDKLRKAGFRLTPQRLAIIDLLEGNKSHPSAYVIFEKMKQKYQTISLATVYKTLKVLVDIGEIQQLTIADTQLVFDPLTEPHSHFYCKQCHQIFDIKLDQKLAVKELNGHFVENYHTYYYGICQTCRFRLS